MIFRKVRLRIALIVIGVFLVFGCARESVIAKVNGEAITKKDLKALLAHAGIKDEAKIKQDGAHNAMRQELINQLINEKLLLQAAKKENIKVDKKEVMRRYNDMSKAFPKEEDFLKKLKERGISRDVILKSIEKDLIVGKFKDSLSMNIPVSDREIKDYYDKNLKTFTTAKQFRLSVIKTDNIDEVRRIKKELEKGASFEETADKYPAGHTGPGAGETGLVTLDTFPSAMAKEIEKIKAGSFGGPIRGREGYYIIKVQEKIEQKVKPFDEVRDNINHILIQQKREDRFQSWFQDARKKAKIEMV